MSAEHYELTGSQVVANFAINQGGSRAILDLPPLPFLAEIVIAGENVRIDIEFGTSRNIKIERVQCPARFSVLGNCTIQAAHDSLDATGFAVVAVRPASAACVPNVAGLETGPVELQPMACRVVAIDACTLTVGGVAHPLGAGESLEVRDAQLVTGTALIFYEI